MGKLIGLKKRQEKATGYSKRTEGPDEIEGMILEEGEEVCSSCKGRGYHPSKQDWNTMASTCQKCNGEGKVDWISNAMGIPKRHYNHASSSYFYGTSGNMGLNGKRPMPVSVAPGAMYVDGNTNKIQVYDGTKWQDVE